MKKIFFLLPLLFAACQSEIDISEDISGTTWAGQTEAHSSKKTYLGDGSYEFEENTRTRDITIRFKDQTNGVTTVVTSNSNPDYDGAGIGGTTSHKFKYTYSADFMSGTMIYEGEYPYKSTFEIRSGFLYDDSELTGYAEYRRL